MIDIFNMNYRCDNRVSVRLAFSGQETYNGIRSVNYPGWFLARNYCTKRTIIHETGIIETYYQ